MSLSIGVVGLGVVGSAIFDVLKDKGYSMVGYDKFKDGGINNITDCMKTDILFLR